MTGCEVLLTPQQVSERYAGSISVRTLANWRTQGDGPAYVKIGAKVLYRMADIESWEARRRRPIV